MRLQIIGNPIAGGGKAKPRIEELVALLEQRGHDVDVRLTTAAGDAERWAGELLTDREHTFDRLIVAGGDGTLNEVVNGLADPSATPIVQMPVGTANVLVRELGLPWEPQGVADLIESGTIMHCDMGEIESLDVPIAAATSDAPIISTARRFLVVMSSGFDAMVIEDIHHNRSGKLGLRGYIRPILRTLANYTPPTLTITVDEGEPISGAMVVVSNSRNYAGLFSVADKAAMDSGVFDVCILPKANLAALLRYGFAAWRAKLSSLPDVTYLNASTVTIRTAESDAGPVPVEADGESFGQTPVKVRILPRMLPIVVPAAKPAAALEG